MQMCCPRGMYYTDYCNCILQKPDYHYNVMLHFCDVFATRATEIISMETNSALCNVIIHGWGYLHQTVQDTELFSCVTHLHLWMRCTVLHHTLHDVYVCICMYTCMYVYVCVYVCVWICMFICMCVCTCMCIWFCYVYMYCSMLRAPWWMSHLTQWATLWK